MTNRAVVAGLARTIGRWDLVAILINVVIGAGILGLPAKAFALVGSYSIIAWVLCALIMALVALCFAEVGSRFTHTGGPYLYAYTAFGPAIGFTVGWLTWVSRLFSYAAISNLAITYASRFWPSLATGVPRFLCVTAATAGITALLLTGMRRSALVNNLLTTCKLALLFGFAIIALASIESRRFVPRALPSLADWQAAIMLMTFAFVGIESAMINTGEMKDPRRDLPFALGVGLGVIALLYVLIQVACIAAVPELGSSQQPVADAAERMLGPAGAWIVGVGALITMSGTLLAVMLTGSRLPFAFAEQGQMPPFLAAVHPRFKTPHAAILVTATLAWIFTIYSSFFAALTVTALTRLVGYVTTCVALLTLRRADTAQPEQGNYRAPFGPLAAVAGASACVWLLLAMSRAELITVAVITLSGVVLGGSFAISRRARVARAAN